MINITKELSSVELSPVGLGPWSFSKLKLLNSCPFSFYLQYLLKAKPLEAPPISVITEMGKAIHRVLELTVNGKSIEDAFKTTRKEFLEVLTDDQWENGCDPKNPIGVAKNEYAVTRFMERLDTFEKANPVKRFITELRIGVTKDWTPTGFFTTDIEKPENNVYFRGVVDLILQLENEDVIFIDHKRSVPSVVGVKNFQAQLDTYKVLFSKGVQPYNNGCSAVHFVNDAELTMGSTSTKQDIEENLANLIEFNIYGAVEKVKGYGYFKHIRGSQCQWCVHDPICKAGHLKPLELESKKWFPIESV